MITILPASIDPEGFVDDSSGILRLASAKAALIDTVLADPEVGIANLLEVYSSASLEQVERGGNWYVNQHQTAQIVGRYYGYGIEAQAGAIAAMSPQTTPRWNNMGAAWVARCAKHGHVGVEDAPGLPIFYANRRKGYAYLSGDTSALSGPKVQSFQRNIAHPYESGAVTIDVHAIGALIGCPISSSQLPEKDSAPRGRYDGLAGIYRQAAVRVNELPHDFQAIVWVAWRENYLGYPRDDSFTAHECIEWAEAIPMA